MEVTVINGIGNARENWMGWDGMGGGEWEVKGGRLRFVNLQPLSYLY